jgi:hypothetical protein
MEMKPNDRAFKREMWDNSSIERRASRVKIRDYRGLLAVFVAAALGISLLCSVSGMAIQDLNESTTAVALQPADIVEAAVSNLNTAGALTKQAFAELIPTSTATLRPTQTATSTVAPLTPTVFKFPTVQEPTRTRRPRPDPSNTSVPPPDTPLPPPTRTPTPIPPTDTLPPPTATDTDIPPTDTDIPPTDTDIPPTGIPTVQIPDPITEAAPIP